MRTGSADLPLHSGHAPRWLFSRMECLAGAILTVLVNEYGRHTVLQRLANPYWFQSFGCVLGFDWHSSGVTTTTCGAIQRALQRQDVGLQVAGGKGTHSRQTLSQLRETSFHLKDSTVQQLTHASRLAAKVDNGCVQDRYQLYHHSVVFSEDGQWCIIQQGLNEHNGYARRYHWLSSQIRNYVEAPHSGIIGEREPSVLDLTARDSAETRETMVDIINDNPAHLIGEQRSLADFTHNTYRHLLMPDHHPVLRQDLDRHTLALFQQLYEYQPHDFADMLLFRGMGPQKVRSLALIAQLVYGSPSSWHDPAKFSFAHGGKDGYPYHVNRQLYDHSIQTLEEAIKQAEIGKKDRLQMLRQLEERVMS